jgi:GNAT superfamily N-acetyltransferase
MSETNESISVEYRPVREAEMAEAVDLFQTTLTDLSTRWNLNWSRPPREYIEKIYDYIRRTGIFMVAEVDGRIGSICHAIVRDHLWFLSGFWTLPGLQGRRIGRPLLELVWGEGARAGANTFFTWSSLELQAMATYMKAGMLPGYQAMTFAGEPRGLSEPGSVYETRPLEPGEASAIDEQVRETRREVDHTFWISEMGSAAKLLVRSGQTIGYYYCNKGAIGPAAWLEDADGEALLAAACREASQQSEQIRLIVPGLNHTAIRFALRANLKLSGYGHLLTTRPFGRMENYLTSGPSLF